MIARHLKALSILAGTVICFAALSPVAGDEAPAPIVGNVELDGDQLAVASLIPKFQALGLRREQAEMLAEQNAGFGTYGLLITAAAIGIASTQANRVVRQSDDRLQHGRAADLLLAAGVGAHECRPTGLRAVYADPAAARATAGRT